MLKYSKVNTRHYNISPLYVLGCTSEKWGFPGGSDGKESTCSARDLGSIPGSGRSLGGGNGNPYQYSCLENPIDRGPLWATAHGVAKSQT